MEKRISMQDIAEKLAGNGNLAKKKSEAFTRLFFEIIQEALIADKFVKIKGFGTFKLISVSERESVSVNTGERIQIGSHSKVSFTPDTLLKDLVNRPFSHFDTVIINDDVDISEFDKIDIESIINNVSEEAELPSEIDTIEEKTQANTSEETQETTDSEITIESGQKENSESVSEEEQSTEPQVTPLTLEVSEETNSFEQPEVNAESDETHEDMIDANGTISKEAESDESSNDLPTDVQETAPATIEQEKEDTPEETHKPQAEVLEETEEPETIAMHEESSHENMVTPRKKCSWWKSILTLISAILLLAIGYTIGYYRLFDYCNFCMPDCKTTSSQQETQTPVSVKDTMEVVKPAKQSTSPKSVETIPDTPLEIAPKEDTLPPAPTIVPEEKIQAVKQSTTTQSQRLKPGKYKIVGTLSTYTIQPNETLRTIAERVYGRRSFASYIIEHNNISDPDNIKDGIVIQLPELALVEN